MLIPKKWLVVVIIIFMIVFYFILHSDEELAIEHGDQINSDPLLEDKNELEESEGVEVEEEKWAVDVKGEIERPGVYNVERGKRVVDVVELAGGFTKEADSKFVNLAELVYDEMVIYVPNREEEALNSAVSQVNNDSRVRVNTATVEELMTLPGIGEQRAQTIIDYREEHGSFTSVEDLLNISGIGEKTLENFKEDIIVP
ncbi:helix-hairpin-helix domain-containing protein [Alkalibacillus haloalkaliphilus]|uniref:Competence protein ComE n=1 Tax=Alkalibacillus haloalkaliphilus TaxID=94136 RepID=A0A511W5V7_9BACI|nr:helix-hairpin-helix domain-containing protein [Alkalibacillus haloalkaliphilus]GEN46479.1 competence protein ComE [Alkalibacillus haloalkaliphilus]